MGCGAIRGHNNVQLGARPGVVFSAHSNLVPQNDSSPASMDDRLDSVPLMPERSLGNTHVGSGLA